jgi:hypothetical protein
MVLHRRGFLDLSDRATPQLRPIPRHYWCYAKHGENFHYAQSPTDSLQTQLPRLLLRTEQSILR